MATAFGLLLITCAALLAGGRVLLARRSNASAWIAAPLTLVVIRSTTAVLLLAGFGLVARFAMQDTTLDDKSTALIAGMLVLLAVVLAALGRSLWWSWKSPTFPERVTFSKRTAASAARYENEQRAA